MNDDFSFLYGEWTVRNRRLNERLAGCTEWTEFSAVQKCWPLMDGIGNVDEMVAPEWIGVSFRLFDVARQVWSIYWTTNRDGVLGMPPVEGTFDGDVGDFYSDEDYEGTPIRVRYRWTKTDPEAPRWEQAFSTDGGETWETNWIMDFPRRHVAATLPV